MTISEAHNLLLTQLLAIYNNSEASNISDIIIEHVTGLKRVDRLLHQQSHLEIEKIKQIETYLSKLLDHTPVQYVLNEAWFYGMKLYVNEHVLIPRPETEELVEWILSSPGSFTLLDIGTGSGCIAVAIKKNNPAATVTACDVSAEAIKVAAANAAQQHTPITFTAADILNRDEWNRFGEFNIIVSNPPYIPEKGRSMMHENVVAHEPHLALFVDNDDPLIFYHTIATFGNEKLLPGGNVFVEMHEDHARATADVFISKGYTGVEIRKDMQGKDRMLKATREA